MALTRSVGASLRRRGTDAERPWLRSHAARGNDQSKHFHAARGNERMIIQIKLTASKLQRLPYDTSASNHQTHGVASDVQSIDNSCRSVAVYIGQIYVDGWRWRIAYNFTGNGESIDNIDGVIAVRVAAQARTDVHRYTFRNTAQWIA